jgi:hypothetical protein
MENQINKKLNIVILISVMIISLLVMIFEGYFRKSIDHIPFVIFGSIIILFDFYVVCFHMSTKRLLSIIPVAGITGYITQVVGTNSDIWVYTNRGQTFFIAIFMFIFVAIAMYGLTTKILSLPLQPVTKTQRKSLFTICWTVFLFIFLVITAQKFKHTITLSFWIYYSLLFVLALYFSLKFTGKTIISITIAAWIIGFASEYFGSQAGIWLFTNNNFPPVFLVVGSWPLEFTLHYCLSAMMVNEIS